MGACRFRIRLSCLPPRRTTSPYSKGNASLTLRGKTIFVDKIYRGNGFWNEETISKNNEKLTPVKAVKSATEAEKQRNRAADDLFSSAVSSVRESVEAFYSWLINKTNIQRTQKCRFSAGILIHTLVKLAIALIFLIFNY